MNKPLKDMTIAELSLLRGQIVGYLDIAIAQARRGGTPWSAIASSLGVSTSEAHRRYSWLDKLNQDRQLPNAD